MEAKETKDDSEVERESAEKQPAKALPDKVERALEKARAAARADHARKSGRWLALIPVGIGALLLALMMPRATPPDSIPVPRADLRVTSAIAKAEDEMAAASEQNRLPTDVLAVGTAVRDLNTAAESEDKNGALDARRRVDAFVVDVQKRPGGDQDLIRLRALQTRLFLDAVDAWERGEQPKDFIAVGGAFIARAEEAGWVKDHRVLLNETERRIAFKTVWNGVTHLDRDVFSLTLDEERAMYAFYIRHPHPPESARLSLLSTQRTSLTPEQCAHARKEVHRQESLWLVDKVKRFAAIDPKYPGMYALGVAYAQAGRQDLAIDAFNLFIEQHPDGPYSLRAKNHLKALIVAANAP